MKDVGLCGEYGDVIQRADSSQRRHFVKVIPSLIIIIFILVTFSGCKAKEEIKANAPEGTKQVVNENNSEDAKQVPNKNSDGNTKQILSTNTASFVEYKFSGIGFQYYQRKMPFAMVRERIKEDGGEYGLNLLVRCPPDNYDACECIIDNQATKVKEIVECTKDGPLFEVKLDIPDRTVISFGPLMEIIKSEGRSQLNGSNKTFKITEKVMVISGYDLHLDGVVREMCPADDNEKCECYFIKDMMGPIVVTQTGETRNDIPRGPGGAIKGINQTVDCQKPSIFIGFID